MSGSLDYMAMTQPEGNDALTCLPERVTVGVEQFEL